MGVTNVGEGEGSSCSSVAVAVMGTVADGIGDCSTDADGSLLRGIAVGVGVGTDVLGRHAVSENMRIGKQTFEINFTYAPLLHDGYWVPLL